MYEKGYVSKAQKVSEELNFQKAKFALEQAESKLHVLLDYTKGKTIKELRSEVEKARSDELAKEQTYSLEKTKEAKLVKQIDNCKLFAPGDGIVVYANDPMRSFGSNAPQIEEGAAVRERQKIFSLPDISRMQVNTKVHESQIDKITPGMKARIRVDAFSDTELEGTVQDVAPLPDPTSFFSSDVKVYTTRVKIDNPLPNLRPGMNAEVTILVDRKENVLSVPVPAVLEYGGKDHLAIRTPNGFERREVDLGVTNDKFVEVTKGITPGAVVALNPLSLISENERRELFGVDGKSAGKKDWVGFAKAKGVEGADAGKTEPGKAAPGAAGKGGDTRRRQGGRPGQGQGQDQGQGQGRRRRLCGLRSQVPQHLTRRPRQDEDRHSRRTQRDPQESRFHRRRARADEADAGTGGRRWLRWWWWRWRRRLWWPRWPRPRGRR